MRPLQYTYLFKQTLVLQERIISGCRFRWFILTCCHLTATVATRLGSNTLELKHATGGFDHFNRVSSSHVCRVSLAFLSGRNHALESDLHLANVPI